MALEKQPFTSYTLDEERTTDKYGKPFTVRLNDWEQKQVDKLKAIFDIKSNGTILKIAAFNYLYVLQHNLNPQYFSWLFKKDRQRLSDYENIKRLISEEL